MRLYNLINPSDAYTFYAPNNEVATCAAWMLSGMFGAEPLEPKDDDTDYGIMPFGGEETFNKEVGDVAQFVKDHRAEIADALASFVVGTRSKSDRAALDELRARMTDEEWKEFYEKRDDEIRSSLNDIGRVAHQLAENLRAIPDAKEADSPA